jgi:predicted nuclease of predicted toxin-antitoxin system
VRLLLDSSIWSPVVDDLRRAGHDVEAVRDWPSDTGDRAILAHANAHGRVLVTLDKDFGTLIMRDRQPHAGLLRLVTDSVHQQTPMVLEAIERFGDDLRAGAIVTVDEDHIRVRPPEDPPADKESRR